MPAQHGDAPAQDLVAHGEDVQREERKGEGDRHHEERRRGNPVLKVCAGSFSKNFTLIYFAVVPRQQGYVRRAWLGVLPPVWSQ